MPLILISGYPSCGKTLRAIELKNQIENIIKTSQFREVSLISQDAPRSIYDDSKQEKTARTNLFSAIERKLDKSTIVIADDLNYIKGYRYQLYCLAKNLATSYCVIHIAAPVELCSEWNMTRKGDCYKDDTLRALIMRYEEPNDTNRWDSPCFTLTHLDCSLPTDAIWGAIEDSSKAIPNNAVKILPNQGHDRLVEMDNVTNNTLNWILELQKSKGSGCIANYPGIKRDIQLPQRYLTMPYLQRCKRQFSQIYKTNTSKNMNLNEQFLTYLESQWNDE